MPVNAVANLAASEQILISQASASFLQLAPVQLP
jgi:hypothetical protein